MKFKQFINNLLNTDEKFRKSYNKYSLKREIPRIVMDSRISMGITQTALARLLKTKQPSIARVEQGSRLPSITFLDKIARALGKQLIIDFVPSNLQRDAIISLTEAIYSKQTYSISSRVDYSQTVPSVSTHNQDINNWSSIQTNTPHTYNRIFV